MEQIKLSIVFHEGAWKMQLGEKLSRAFVSEREAIQAAVRHAHTIGRQGHEVEVVMKMMTCYYNGNGFVRAVPTPRE